MKRAQSSPRELQVVQKYLKYCTVKVNLSQNCFSALKPAHAHSFLFLSLCFCSSSHSSSQSAMPGNVLIAKGCELTGNKNPQLCALCGGICTVIVGASD